jgi:hypothetical protein
MSAGVIASSYVDSAPPLPDPPSFIDSKQGGASGSTTDITAPIPVGYAVGDTLIFAAYRNQGGTITDPAGWGPPVVSSVAPSGALRLLVWIKVADGTETDPHATGSSASQYDSVCAAYEASTPENIISNSVVDGGQPCPSGTTTTTGQDTLVHIAGAERNTVGPGSIGFDAAVTPRSTNDGPSNFYRILLGDEERLTPGAVPSRDCASSNGGWMGYAVIPLKP